MVIIILLIVGTPWIVVAILRDKHPEEYNAFMSDAKGIIRKTKERRRIAKYTAKTRTTSPKVTRHNKNKR